MDDQTTDAPTATQDAAQTNTGNYEKFIKDVRELGKDGAKGKDALPKLAFKVIDAITQGVLSYTPQPKGTDDEADQVYGEYAKYEAKTAIHERKFAAYGAQVSKLRQIMKASVMTTCDFKGVAVRTTELQKEMFDAKQKPKSVYPSLVSVAREQQKQDQSLTDDQIREAIMTGAEEPSVEKELQKAADILERLITGAKGLKDQSDETEAAFRSVDKRIKDLATLGTRAQFEAMALELGYGPASATHDAS